MRSLASVVLGLALACAAPGAGPGPRGSGEAAAGAVLASFAQALEEGRFADAHALLSARWRASYTPGRLALDFAGAGPAGPEAARRVLAALSAGAEPSRDPGGRARLALEGGRAAVLVAEPGGWRVDALE